MKAYMRSFLGEIYIKVYFFSTFVANRIFETFFAKRGLIRYYYLINIYIIY